MRFSLKKIEAEVLYKAVESKILQNQNLMIKVDNKERDIMLILDTDTLITTKSKLRKLIWGKND